MAKATQKCAASGKLSKAEVDDLLNELQAILEGLLQGAREDVRLYAAAIIANYETVLRQPDPAKRAAIMSELNGQVLLLGETTRLRAVNAQFAAIERILAMLIRLLLAAL